MKKALFLLVVIIFFFSGCAQVPKESVELSVTVGRDLAEVHRAHRELAIRYFYRIKQDINSFVDDVYKPYTIKVTLEKFQLIEKIKESQKPDAKYETLTVLDVYVTKVTDEIENFRQSMIEPIEEKENRVLMVIDDSYQKIQNANSIVTGHLASIRKVHEAQAELLDRAGLEGLREGIIENAFGFSDKIESLVKEGRKTEAKVEEVSNLVEDFKKLVHNFSDLNPDDKEEIE